MRYKPVIAGGLITMGIFAWFYDRLFVSPSSDDINRSVYDFRVKSLEGDVIAFDQFKGKNLLIVNTASKCGYTPQYELLQQLHEQYGDRVAVLGFPANNFLWQEPGSNTEIATFCQKNYGVTFQMFEKISVRGKDQHPLYQWLAKKSGKNPKWNFCKYLINSEGEVTAFFGPKVSPLDDAIINKISR